MEVPDQTLFDGQFRLGALGFSNASGCRGLAAGRRESLRVSFRLDPPCEESTGRGMTQSADMGTATSLQSLSLPSAPVEPTMTRMLLLLLLFSIFVIPTASEFRNIPDRLYGSLRCVCEGSIELSVERMKERKRKVGSRSRIPGTVGNRNEGFHDNRSYPTHQPLKSLALWLSRALCR